MVRYVCVCVGGGGVIVIMIVMVIVHGIVIACVLAGFLFFLVCLPSYYQSPLLQAWHWFAGGVPQHGMAWHVVARRPN